MEAGGAAALHVPRSGYHPVTSDWVTAIGKIYQRDLAFKVAAAKQDVESNTRNVIHENYWSILPISRARCSNTHSDRVSLAGHLSTSLSR
jgi:hypothetical protein